MIIPKTTEIETEIEKLKTQIMTMGLNGRAYTPIWNEKVLKLKELTEIKTEIEKLKTQIMTMGLNGRAYTPIWNEKVLKLKELKAMKTTETQLQEQKPYLHTRNEMFNLGYEKGKAEALKEVNEMIDEFDITKCLDVNYANKDWQKELKQMLKEKEQEK